MKQDKKTITQSDRDEQDVTRKPSQQQQGGNPGSGGRRQQQQEAPGSKPTPGGGAPEVQEDLPDRDRMSDRGSRKPQVDVERE